MFKVNNKNTRTRCEICSKLTLKISERRQCLPPPPILHENLDPPFYDFSKTPTPLQVWGFHTINNPWPIVFIMAHQMCQKHFLQQFIKRSLIWIKIMHFIRHILIKNENFARMKIYINFGWECKLPSEPQLKQNYFIWSYRPLCLW